MAVVRAAAVVIAIMMATSMVSSFNSDPVCAPDYPNRRIAVLLPGDRDTLQFALNLEYLEAELFLWAVLGYGLDRVAPGLAMGGPPPISAQKANLDPLTTKIIYEFGLQEVGHLKILKTTVGGFPRPMLNLSAANFAKLLDDALGYKLNPPFDPYRDPISFMIGAYVVPYVGLVGYVGANPNLVGSVPKRILAGLLAVEAGQDAVIRGYLYERAAEVVRPYNYTVADFTVRISELRNKLGKCGVKDEGIVVAQNLGAEGRTTSNVLSADQNSLGYGRTPREVLRIVQGTGDERVPGGFFPQGGNGRIAKDLLASN